MKENTALRAELKLNGANGNGSNGNGKLPPSDQQPELHAAVERLVNSGLTGAALDERIIEASETAGVYPRELKDLVRKRIEEQEQQEDIAASFDTIERLRHDDSRCKAIIPPVMMEQVMEVVRSDQREFDYTTMLTVVLTAFSASLPLRSHVHLGGSFTQPLILWLLLLISSGNGKSPLLKRLVRIPWKQSVAAIHKSNYAYALEEWNAMDEDERPERPRMPFTYLTGENLNQEGLEQHLHLHELHQWAQRSVLIDNDEAAAMIENMAGKKGAAGNDRQFAGFLLSRFDGEGFANSRVEVKRERPFDACRLALLFCCQPDLYFKLAGDENVDASGIASRFMTIRQQEVEEIIADDSDEEQAALPSDYMEHLFLFGASAGEFRAVLSPEAAGLFRDVRRKYKEQKKDPQLGEAEKTIINKAPGIIGRMAALLELIWLHDADPTAQVPHTVTVSDLSMQRAIDFHALTQAHTISARAAAGDPITALCSRIQSKLASQVPVALSDLRRSLGANAAGRPSTQQVLAACRELQARNLGSLVPVVSRGKDGWHFTPV
jgi:hypothetical protein